MSQRQDSQSYISVAGAELRVPARHGHQPGGAALRHQLRLPVRRPADRSPLRSARPGARRPAARARQRGRVEPQQHGHRCHRPVRDQSGRAAAFLVRPPSRPVRPSPSLTYRDSRRATTEGDWRRDFTFDNGLRLSPFAEARGDIYSINNGAITSGLNYATVGKASSTVTRATGTIGVDASWPFIRPLGARLDHPGAPGPARAVAQGQAQRQHPQRGLRLVRVRRDHPVLHPPLPRLRPLRRWRAAEYRRPRHRRLRRRAQRQPVGRPGVPRRAGPGVQRRLRPAGDVVRLDHRGHGHAVAGPVLLQPGAHRRRHLEGPPRGGRGQSLHRPQHPQRPLRLRREWRCAGPVRLPDLHLSVRRDCDKWLAPSSARFRTPNSAAPPI